MLARAFHPEHTYKYDGEVKFSTLRKKVEKDRELLLDALDKGQGGKTDFFQKLMEETNVFEGIL